MGSDAVLKIVDEKQAGRVTGKTTLTLALYPGEGTGQTGSRSIRRTWNARPRPARARQGEGLRASAPAVGALAGAALGGGKGAAIGAGADSRRWGTAAAAMTHGEHIKIPAESLLTFTLDAPVTI